MSWTVSTTSKEFRFINCFQPIFNRVLQFDRKNVHELAAELIGPNFVMISVSIRDKLLGTYQRNVKDAQRAWIKVINQLNFNSCRLIAFKIMLQKLHVPTLHIHVHVFNYMKPKTSAYIALNFKARKKQQKSLLMFYIYISLLII